MDLSGTKKDVSLVGSKLKGERALRTEDWPRQQRTEEWAGQQRTEEWVGQQQEQPERE